MNRSFLSSLLFLVIVSAMACSPRQDEEFTSGDYFEQMLAYAAMLPVGDTVRFRYSCRVSASYCENRFVADAMGMSDQLLLPGGCVDSAGNARPYSLSEHCPSAGFVGRCVAAGSSSGIENYMVNEGIYYSPISASDVQTECPKGAASSIHPGTWIPMASIFEYHPDYPIHSTYP